jgi:hypothetical protein
LTAPIFIFNKICIKKLPELAEKRRMSKMNTEQHSTKGKKNPLTISLYVGSIIAALSGAILLISNIILYNDTVAQYVAMGYDAADVTAQMLPSQLLPALLQSIALYGGIALALFAIGQISHKLSDFMKQSIPETTAVVAASEPVPADTPETDTPAILQEEMPLAVDPESDSVDAEKSAAF